jgi:hypothetical protein
MHTSSSKRRVTDHVVVLCDQLGARLCNPQVPMAARVQPRSRLGGGITPRGESHIRRNWCYMGIVQGNKRMCHHLQDKLCSGMGDPGKGATTT